MDNKFWLPRLSIFTLTTFTRPDLCPGYNINVIELIDHSYSSEEWND